MELYAKVLLYDLRITHQLERVQALKKNDIQSYVRLIYQHIHPELQKFIESQERVTQLAKIDYNIYYASQ